MTKFLHAQFVVSPGNEERVRELVLELTALVRAEAGNLEFTPYTLESNPRHYFVFEAYRDDAAFDEHISAEYGLRFNRELAPLIEGDASELTWLAPVR